MDERLVYRSRLRLRWGQASAVLLVVGLVLATWAGVLGRTREDLALALLLVIAATIGFVSITRRFARPVPVLRLSPDGLEGSFGRLEWHDVTSVEVKRRLGLQPYKVVVRVRPSAQLHPTDREFEEITEELHLIRRDRLIFETTGLEVGAVELARGIEHHLPEAGAIGALTHE